MGLKDLYKITLQRSGMKRIINPVDPNVLKKELTPDKFIRLTNAASNEIYIIDAHNAPNVMREIGRLREISFRDAGGGTGDSLDVDKYDTAKVPFKQIVVWNPIEREIVGGYRYIKGGDIEKDENGYPLSPTSKLFKLSPEFIEQYLPHTIELGRSFVQPKYQPTNNFRYGLYSLDNIWDGLGAIVKDNPDIYYFYGKMTMYNSYNREARNLILYFLNHYFKGDDGLMQPFDFVDFVPDEAAMGPIFNPLKFPEAFKLLNKKVRELNENIPSLVKIYMGLTSTMRSYGTSPNYEFGPVEETAILLNIRDIYQEKIDRHVSTYLSIKDLW